MAGAYNHNVIKSAMSMLEEHPDTKLYVVGEVGRQFFTQHGIPIEQSFLYPAKDPTLRRAREITGMLLEKFAAREFQKIYIIYTDMKSSLVAEPYGSDFCRSTALSSRVRRKTRRKSSSSFLRR